MNNFSIFSAKVLLCAAVACAPMGLLFTGIEASTYQAAERAQYQNRAEYPALASTHAGVSTAHGVVVG